jgi:hypothetical protein
MTTPAGIAGLDFSKKDVRNAAVADAKKVSEELSKVINDYFVDDNDVLTDPSKTKDELYTTLEKSIKVLSDTENEKPSILSAITGISNADTSTFGFTKSKSKKEELFNEINRYYANINNNIPILTGKIILLIQNTKNAFLNELVAKKTEVDREKVIIDRKKVALESAIQNLSESIVIADSDRIRSAIKDNIINGITDTTLDIKLSGFRTISDNEIQFLTDLRARVADGNTIDNTIVIGNVDVILSNIRELNGSISVLETSNTDLKVFIKLFNDSEPFNEKKENIIKQRDIVVKKANKVNEKITERNRAGATDIQKTTALNEAKAASREALDAKTTALRYYNSINTNTIPDDNPLKPIAEAIKSKAEILKNKTVALADASKTFLDSLDLSIDIRKKNFKLITKISGLNKDTSTDENCENILNNTDTDNKGLTQLTEDLETKIPTIRTIPNDIKYNAAPTPDQTLFNNAVDAQNVLINNTIKSLEKFKYIIVLEKIYVKAFKEFIIIRDKKNDAESLRFDNLPIINTNFNESSGLLDNAKYADTDLGVIRDQRDGIINSKTEFLTQITRKKEAMETLYTTGLSSIASTNEKQNELIKKEVEKLINVIRSLKDERFKYFYKGNLRDSINKLNTLKSISRVEENKNTISKIIAIIEAIDSLNNNKNSYENVINLLKKLIDVGQFIKTTVPLSDFNKNLSITVANISSEYTEKILKDVNYTLEESFKIITKTLIELSENPENTDDVGKRVLSIIINYLEKVSYISITENLLSGVSIKTDLDTIVDETWTTTRPLTDFIYIKNILVLISNIVEARAIVPPDYNKYAKVIDDANGVTGVNGNLKDILINVSLEASYNELNTVVYKLKSKKILSIDELTQINTLKDIVNKIVNEKSSNTEFNSRANKLIVNALNLISTKEQTKYEEDQNIRSKDEKKKAKLLLKTKEFEKLEKNINDVFEKLKEKTSDLDRKLDLPNPNVEIVQEIFELKNEVEKLVKYLKNLKEKTLKIIGETRAFMSSAPDGDEKNNLETIVDRVYDLLNANTADTDLSNVLVATETKLKTAEESGITSTTLLKDAFKSSEAESSKTLSNFYKLLIPGFLILLILAVLGLIGYILWIYTDLGSKSLAISIPIAGLLILIFVYLFKNPIKVLNILFIILFLLSITLIVLASTLVKDENKRSNYQALLGETQSTNSNTIKWLAIVLGSLSGVGVIVLSIIARRVVGKFLSGVYNARESLKSLKVLFWFLVIACIVLIAVPASLINKSDVVLCSILIVIGAVVLIVTLVVGLKTYTFKEDSKFTYSMLGLALALLIGGPCVLIGLAAANKLSSDEGISLLLVAVFSIFLFLIIVSIGFIIDSPSRYFTIGIYLVIFIGLIITIGFVASANGSIIKTVSLIGLSIITLVVFIMGFLAVFNKVDKSNPFYNFTRNPFGLNPTIQLDKIREWGFTSSTGAIIVIALISAVVLMFVSGVHYIDVYENASAETQMNTFGKSFALIWGIFNFLIGSWITIQTIYFVKVMFDMIKEEKQKKCIETINKDGFDETTGLPAGKFKDILEKEYNLAYFKDTKDSELKVMAEYGIIDPNGVYIPKQFLNKDTKQIDLTEPGKQIAFDAYMDRYRKLYNKGQIVTYPDEFIPQIIEDTKRSLKQSKAPYDIKQELIEKLKNVKKESETNIYSPEMLKDLKIYIEETKSIKKSYR